VVYTAAVGDGEVRSSWFRLKLPEVFDFCLYDKP